jgi:hypothetical protein
MTPPVQAYRPENHQDFDRLYTETYRRVFATLVVVLRNPDAAEDAAQEGLRACRAWKTCKKDAPPKPGSSGSRSTSRSRTGGANGCTRWAKAYGVSAGRANCRSTASRSTDRS